MSVHLNVVMTIPGKDPREFEYEFDGNKITLGREQDNDIQVPLSTVSRNHANIVLEGEDWYIEDLRSTHGTHHNGKPLGQGGKKLLRNGDTIEIVHFKITFRNTGEGTLSEDYSQERTEALAQKMVQEVLASIGSDGETPFLRVMNGPDEGARFPLTTDQTEVVVGRGADADFQINDANISRRHATIRRDWNDITIEDLGSKNGVIINDKKINKNASLRDADEILLGAVRLTFIDPTAKYLGKLDDIPAFANETEAEHSAVEDNADDPGMMEPEAAPEPPQPEPPQEVAPLDDLPLPSEGEEGEEQEEDEGGKLGAVEYGLIVGLVVVVIGLAIGVVLVLLS